jgi:predicted ArsR family transcriptional regulator
VVVPSRELPKLSDPRMLRGIAHPMRNRILEEMEAGGPMRAADIAERLDIPANQASFHLRQLAKYGLVVEAPEHARDGRDRVWRAAHEGGMSVNLGELAKEEGGKAAVAVFRKAWMANAHDLIDRADQPAKVKDAMVAVSQTALRLTKADAKKFSEELNDLVEKWRISGQARKTARTYEVLWVLEPAKAVEP